MNDGEPRVITPLRRTTDAEGFYARVELADGTELGLVPLYGGRVRITVGPPSGWTSFDDGW